MIVSSSPRGRLAASKESADAVGSVIAQPGFRLGADATLLQMLHEAPETTDPVVAAAAYHRLIGARQFLAAFSVIHVAAAPVTRQPAIPPLDHLA
jgi:hypothetical protein